MATKELYLSEGNIEQQASKLFQRVAGQSRRDSPRFEPAKSALLVLDMQAYFLDASSHAYIPSAKAIIVRILQLIIEYHKHGMPIVFTQHINSIEDAGMMARWWKDLITIENPLCQIIPEIDISMGIVVQKSQYDAFHQTQLEALLHARNATQLVLCGVMTHLCCETTARSAFMRGFEVFFPVDGTATYSLDHHEATLLNLAHGFATIVRMRDILDAMRFADGS